MKKNIAMMAILSMVFMVLSMGALADTLVVTNPADNESAGTLRDALHRAADGDTIAIQTDLADICSTCTIKVPQKELTFLGGIEGKSKRTDLPSISKFRFLQKGSVIKFKNCNIHITNDLWNSYNHLNFENCRIFAYLEYPDEPDQGGWCRIVAYKGGTIDFNKCIFKFKSTKVDYTIWAMNPDSRIKIRGAEIYPAKGDDEKDFATFALLATNKGTVDVRATCYHRKGRKLEFRNSPSHQNSCHGYYDMGTLKSKIKFATM